MTKKITYFLISTLLFFLLFFTNHNGLFSQDLSGNDPVPVLDGIIKNKEYSVSIDFKGGKLFISRHKNRLYAGITARTDGWVAIGFNSLRMNNADIIIGYVKGNSKIVKLQRGSGRSHRDYDIPYVLKYNIDENNGNTSLEVEVKIGDKPEDLKFKSDLLNMIIAYGKNDDIRSHHTFRKSVKVKLKN